MQALPQRDHRTVGMLPGEIFRLFPFRSQLPRHHMRRAAAYFIRDAGTLVRNLDTLIRKRPIARKTHDTNAIHDLHLRHVVMLTP